MTHQECLRSPLRCNGNADEATDAEPIHAPADRTTTPAGEVQFDARGRIVDQHARGHIVDQQPDIGGGGCGCGFGGYGDGAEETESDRKKDAESAPPNARLARLMDGSSSLEPSVHARRGGGSVAGGGAGSGDFLDGHLPAAIQSAHFLEVTRYL